MIFFRLGVCFYLATVEVLILYMDVMYNALQNAKNACHCIANTCDVDMTFFFKSS